MEFRIFFVIRVHIHTVQIAHVFRDFIPWTRVQLLGQPSRSNLYGVAEDTMSYS